MKLEEREKIAGEFHRLLDESKIEFNVYIDHWGDEVILDGWFSKDQLETILRIWQEAE